MEKMKVVHVGIRNILGIRELSCKPGKITSIDGPNGSGKTSFLKAVKAALGGGHDAKLLREGSETGEIVLVFENGMKLTKKVGKEKSGIVLKDANGGKVDKAASFLKDIVDQVGLNPIQLLTAPQKERVNILLDSAPLELPGKKIKEGLGVILDPQDTRHPIQIMDALRKDLFDRRADKNREVKAKAGMVDQMRESTSFVDSEVDYSALVDNLADQKFKKETEFNKSISDEKEKCVQACERDAALMRKNIGEIEALARKNIKEQEENYQEIADRYREEMDDSENRIRLSFSPKLTKFSEEIATAKEKGEAQTKVKVANEFIDEGMKEIEILETVSNSLAAKLILIDAMKKDMLANFPINGLEIREGEIYLDGVVFDNVNEARRIGFALELASIRGGDLPLVCVDGLEALDSNSFKLFCEMASKTPMQFFVTRVNDSDRLSMHVMDEKSE